MGTFRFMATTTVAALVCVQAAVAQVTDDARKVLTESAAAIGKVQSMTFHSRRYATGPLEGVLNTEGDVKLIRNGPDRAKATIRMTGKTQEAGRGKRDFDVLVDNNVVTWIDAPQKKVVERQVAPKGEGSSEMSIAQQLIMEDLFAAEPFRQQLMSTTPGFKVTVEGNEAVGGEVCEIVKASYNEGVREVYIHISAADRLPRKLELRGNPAKGATNQAPLSMIVEMTNVKVNTGLKPTELALATPDGFTRDIQQAPAPQANPVANAPAAVIGLPPGTDAPAFNLKNTKGEPVSLASMKNNVVVLAFWGTWNGSWKKAAPTVEKINASFNGKPVKMVGIAVREKDPAAVASRWTEDKMTFPTTIAGEGDKTADDYQVKGYPTFVIIGGDGKIVDFIQGFAGEEQFSARMNASINRAVDAIKK